ncbi:MAG: multidrug ABC transporter ATP-binding protein, partial [Wolbachia sp.]
MRSNIRQLFYYIKPNLSYFIIAFIAVLFSALMILLFGRGLSNIIDSGTEHDFTTKLLVAILIVLAISLTAFTR